MEKFIPFEKLSKKEKKKRNAQARNTWGALNPATRKPANSKAYNRQKAQNKRHGEWNQIPSPCFLFLRICRAAGAAFCVFRRAGRRSDAWVCSKITA